MKRKIKSCALYLAIAFLAVASSALLLINRPTKKAVAENCPVTLSQPLATKYILGNEVTIPTASILYNGGEITAEKHKLTAPDGSAVSNGKVTLTQVGKYVLTYYKTVDNIVVSGETSFVVQGSSFTVGQNSQVNYGKNAKLAEIEGLKDKEGLNVTLASGDTFTCNLPIDLTGVTSQDALLNLMPLPQTVGVADATELYVVLTDAYDESNYVTIKTVHKDFSGGEVGSGIGRSYQCAGASNQQLTGIRVASQSAITYDGEPYLVEVGGADGYRSFCSLSAAGGYGESRGLYTLSMNYGERILYGSKQFNSYGGSVIVDLDNPLFFTEFWDGFTTGECYLSIYAGGYTTATTEFMVTDILGVGLNGKEVENTQQPEIVVEEKENVYAVVGKPFQIYPAIARDVYTGIVDYDVKVLYNGNTAVPVENGGFTPKYAGRYTMVYSVRTTNGQTATKKAFVDAYASSPIDIEFETVNQLVAGETYLFRNEEVLRTSGDYTLSMRAVLKSDNTISYDIEKTEDGYAFTPLYAGAYDIIYAVDDYIGRTEKSRAVTVANGTVVLKEAATLPQYFIANATYRFEAVKCYDLTTGAPVEKDAEIYYQFDDQAAAKIENGSLKIAANNSAKIIFRYGGTDIEVHTIPVIAVGYGTKEIESYKYFHSVDGSMTFTDADKPAEGTNVDYAAYTFSRDYASMQFIKPISVSRFEFSFSLPACQFSTMYFAFNNGEENLVLALRQTGAKQSILSINEETEFLVSAVITDGSNISLRYNNDTRTVGLVIGGEVYNYTIPTNVFAGFEKGTAYFALAAADYSGSAASRIRVFKLNNQKISYKTLNDRTVPEIYNSIRGGIQKLGEKVVLKGIGAEDVLSVNTACTFSVFAPDGSVVTAEDGTTLKDLVYDKEYTFTLTSYGNYRIEISAEDDYDRKTTSSVNVTVNDDVAPTITMDGEQVTMASGGIFTIKNYTVSDNLDSTEDITVRAMLISPSGATVAYVQEGVTLTEKGEYVVLVYAVDTAQNIAQKNYTVVVK